MGLCCSFPALFPAAAVSTAHHGEPALPLSVVPPSLESSPAPLEFEVPPAASSAAGSESTSTSSFSSSSSSSFSSQPASSLASSSIPPELEELDPLAGIAFDPEFAHQMGHEGGGGFNDGHGKMEPVDTNLLKTELYQSLCHVQSCLPQGMPEKPNQRVGWATGSLYVYKNRPFLLTCAHAFQPLHNKIYQQTHSKKIIFGASTSAFVYLQKEGAASRQKYTTTAWEVHPGYHRAPHWQDGNDLAIALLDPPQIPAGFRGVTIASPAFDNNPEDDRLNWRMLVAGYPCLGPEHEHCGRPFFWPSSNQHLVGECLPRFNDPFDETQAPVLEHQYRTLSGQSGSPVVLIDPRSDKSVVVGVHVGTTSPSNYATPLTSQNIQWLHSACEKLLRGNAGN